MSTPTVQAPADAPPVLALLDPRFPPCPRTPVIAEYAEHPLSSVLLGLSRRGYPTHPLLPMTAVSFERNGGLRRCRPCCGTGQHYGIGSPLPASKCMWCLGSGKEPGQ